MANYTIVGIDNRLLTIDPELPPLVYTFSRGDTIPDGGLAVKIYEIDPTTGVVTGYPILDLPSTNVDGYNGPYNISVAGGKSYVIQPVADQWPSEISWVVHDNNGAVVQSLNGNNLQETPGTFVAYDQANYLDFTFTCPNLDTKTYEWKRGTVIVSSTATYRLVADDTDNVITVTVTEDNGTVSTDSTSTIISLADARSNGYTASQGRAVGYTATEMKAAGYTATELKAAGYTVAELKAGGYTATELKAAGYTATELKAGGYTATELKAGGYTVSELKAGEYTLAEILSANFYTTEILANFDAVQWVQKGEDIDGEAASDQCGYTVSMNSTGTRVAIGANFNDGNGANSGHTRVYENNDGTWGQLGADIDGEAAGDYAGWSVNMNSTGTRVAIGAVYNDGNGANSGHVRVFEYNGTTWEQLGADIDGETVGDYSGYSVNMNSTGTIVAIGGVSNAGNGANSGHVRVFEYNGTTWGQLGADIDGQAGGDYSGWSVSMSSDGTIVAIGGIGPNVQTGNVRVFEYNGTTWEQVGADIDGEAAVDQSGNSVSMNSAGTRVAIGARYNDGNGNKSGHVRVYENNDGTWGKLGADIDGEAASDQCGYSVSMNSAGTQVAIGARYNAGNGANSGHVRVFEYNGTTWEQLGADIDGEAAGDYAGFSVNMNSDGTMVAIGAVNNDGNGSNSGHVRVYEQLTLQSLIDAAGGGVFPGIDFYFEGLASTFALTEAIEFLDVDFQSSTLEDIPHVEITLTNAQRIQLNKMFAVELAEDTHIDQATSTLTDEVYESSVTGYQTDETKMPHMGTDLSLATQSLKNNGHRVSPTTHGEASVKFMQRNMDTDTIANSFVSDLIHQAILFRFVENELSNEDDLVDEIEDFLEGTETYHLSGILNQKLIDSKTDETQPHSLAYASFHTLVKTITDSANAQQNKRLTNDPINGMFRDANKVGYVDVNNQGDDNLYYMEYLPGDQFIFKLTLNPSATPVAPVYANGQVPSQQPRSLFIKLKIE